MTRIVQATRAPSPPDAAHDLTTVATLGAVQDAANTNTNPTMQHTNVILPVTLDITTVATHNSHTTHDSVCTCS